MEFIISSDAVQQWIEQQMEQHADTEIDWPLQPQGAVLLNCQLRPGDPKLMAKARQWEKNTKQMFEGIMQTMEYDKVTSLRDLWDKVSQSYCHLLYLQ